MIRVKNALDQWHFSLPLDGNAPAPSWSPEPRPVRCLHITSRRAARPLVCQVASMCRACSDNSDLRREIWRCTYGAVVRRDVLLMPLDVTDHCPDAMVVGTTNVNANDPDSLGWIGPNRSMRGPSYGSARSPVVVRSARLGPAVHRASPSRPPAGTSSGTTPRTDSTSNHFRHCAASSVLAGSLGLVCRPSCHANVTNRSSMSVGESTTRGREKPPARGSK